MICMFIQLLNILFYEHNFFVCDLWAMLKVVKAPLKQFDFRVPFALWFMRLSSIEKSYNNNKS